MTKKEARTTVKRIREDICYLMQDWHELWVRKGFKALGYSDYKECIQKELSSVLSYGYAQQMKDAGVARMNIYPKLPMGKIMEGMLRPMHPLSTQQRKTAPGETGQGRAGQEVPWPVRSNSFRALRLATLA
jgi:hypothetical protein